MNKTAKRIAALLLACALLPTLAACGKKNEGEPAAQSGDQNGALPADTAEESVVDFAEAGVSFTKPASWDAEDILLSGSGEKLEEGVTIAYVQLYAYSGEEIGELQTKYADDYDAYVEKLLERKYDLFTVFGIDGGRGEAELEEIAEGVAETDFTLTKLGEADGWTFFSMVEAAKPPVPPEEKAEVVKKALSDVPKALSGMRFYEPVPAPTAEVGSVVSFETTDINGETVTSAELFGGCKITMVNLWMSWCGPCVREMPELEKLNKSFADKDCQIVGILLDGDDADALAEGLDIVADTGVTYPVLKPFEGIDDMLPTQAYPTTYFVDSEGRVLGEPVIGADVEKYQTVLDSLLRQQG
ncbi:MAG: TlpA family protein disulfide reductase [Ruminococcaceae bacterium]|jgi:thiol-disulfide isomerase/thioredoxin|nr:TlpA family protein disulfide reductase [Oscillospiraceae bacterium]